MVNMVVVLFIVNIFIVGISYLLGGLNCVQNIEIGFLTSSLVILSSLKSYRSMVEGRLNVEALPSDERDTLDKLEDPYELYDEEQEKDREKSLQEIVKEERKKLKRNGRTFLEATKDSKAAFSFYRLGAYSLLILGFFYLNNHKILDIPLYLFSLSLPSLVIIFLLMNKR